MTVAYQTTGKGCLTECVEGGIAKGCNSNHWILGWKRLGKVNHMLKQYQTEEVMHNAIHSAELHKALEDMGVEAHFTVENATKDLNTRF